MPFKMTPKSPLTKKLVGKQHNLPDHLKQKILDAPETPMTPMTKTKEERIRSKKQGTTANVTRRLNEGNIKGAKLSRKMNVASTKGKKAKADRLERKRDTADQDFFKKEVQRSRNK